MDRTSLVEMKKIALVAHDNMKRDMIEWASFNKEFLQQHYLYATGTSGKIKSREII